MTLFCGAGCQGSHAQIIELAGRLKSPIVHTLRGKEHVEYDNPYDVGMTGLVGFASGYNAMMSSDVLLVLGADFPYRQFFPEHARIAQVDLRPEALGNRCSLELGVLGDVQATLQALNPLVAQKSDSYHLDRALEDYRASRHGLDALAESKPHATTIHPQYRHPSGQRTGRRRRCLHLRRRHASRLGRPLSDGERQTAHYRLVQSWLDGQCDAPCHRRPGRFPQGRPGHLDVRRRRFHDDDGRVRHPHSDRPAGQDRGAEQRHAGLCRDWR